MINKFIRGQLWMIRTYINKDDRVFSGEHIALILGVNKENTLTIIPSTSKLNPENKILTTVELELTNLDGVTTIGHFIPNMIQTIDTKKALRYIGMLDKRSVMEVQRAVGEYLGFKFEQSFDNDKKSEYKQPIVKEEKHTPVAKQEKQKPIEVTSNSNIGRPSKLLPKVGDIKYVNGRKYECIIEGKKAYGGFISKWPKDVLDNMVEMYKNNWSKAGIAYQYGISSHTVGDYLKSRGF